MATTFEYWQYEYYQSQSQTPPNLMNAANSLLKQIPDKDQALLQSIETQLNEIVLHSDAEKLSEAFYQNLATYGGAPYQGERATGKFSASYAELGRLWAAYNIKAKELQQTGEELASGLGKENEELKNLQKEIFQKRQKLVNITGQMFENLLQTSIPLIETTVDGTTDDVVQSLINLLDNPNTGKIVTQGSSKGDRITYTIDGINNQVKIQGTGKIDVSLSAAGPFPELNISAKSYSNARDISLFTGKLLPLMATWPTTNYNKHYYYNALLREAPETFLLYTRLILAIQSLIGIHNKGSAKNLADVLILYNRANKTNPIKVYSINELVKNVLSFNDINVIQTAFPMTLRSLPSQRIRDEDPSAYAISAMAVELNAKLNKAYFAVNALNKIALKNKR